MSAYHYRVFFTRADVGDLVAEVNTKLSLENDAGRVEAEKALAARGVRTPKIVGWALRRTDGLLNHADQEKPL